MSGYAVMPFLLEASRYAVQQRTSPTLTYGIPARQLDVRSCKIHPSRFGRRRYAKYTPDLTAHDTIDGWLAHGDLAPVSDALAVILERLVDQPLPDRTSDTTPLEREREQFAKQAQELAAHAAQFAAGLVW
ncbi:hypothetical protein [Streptomyces luteogriseus]|uniref:hypothetical protein n=1 Tax=Streptomyces luteogriseus TaxID=68233 RepID=UPI003791D6D4